MRWEYRVVSEVQAGKQYGNEEAYLNAVGDDGWELVALVGLASMRYLYLKRPKP